MLISLVHIFVWGKLQVFHFANGIISLRSKVYEGKLPKDK